MDHFTDVDFRKDPRYVLGDLTPDDCRAFDLGPRLFGASAPSYEDFYATIPESEWRDRIDAIDKQGGGMDTLVTRIFDQGQEGSCVGNAGTQGHQVIQALQYGKDNVVQLSAVSLYQQIGSSPGSGAMVEDCLEAGTKTGILPLDTPENRQRFGDCVMPHTGFYNKKPANWKETAKLFRFDETLVVRTVEGLMTALFNGHPVQVGRQGHSILYVRPTWRNNDYQSKYANSWTPQWGDHGFGYDTMSQIRMSARWAFAVRSVVVPSK